VKIPRPQPSPTSLANLRPWKPGQSGNPGGRPAGLEQRVRELVDFDKVTLVLQDIVLGMPCEDGTREKPSAKDTDRIAAAKLLFERGFGRPREEVVVDLGRLGDLSDAELEQMLLDEVTREIGIDQLRALVEAKFGPGSAKGLIAPIDVASSSSASPGDDDAAE
jgi:hypothetical protein